jgi:gliding motility-associated-like protein
VVIRIVIVLLTSVFWGFPFTAQEQYNNCNQALDLCPGEIYSVNNLGSNITFCPGCEDDFTICFSPNNSIWLSFTTNSSGGNVTVDINSLVFESTAGSGNALHAQMFSAIVPCNAASYTSIGNCALDENTDFTLNATGLQALTTYYIVISGSDNGAGVTSPAECTFNVSISGSAVDRPLPQLTILPGDTPICKNSIFTASAVLTDCPETQDYIWFVNGVQTAVTSDPTFSSSSLSNGDVIRVETSCYSDCPVILTEETLPIDVVEINVDAGSDLFIDFGDTIQLNGTTSATAFEWSPSFIMSNSSVINPFVWPVSTTVFTLTASEGDCSISDQVTVHVEPQLNIPNTFSPNDDGINDTWVILGIELYPDCYLRIYDRWGQEVYQSTGYSAVKSWDGTSRSGKLSEGVYFYILDLRDEDKQQFKGSITLIR